MNSRRDYRGSRSPLFDDHEAGADRESSSHSTIEITEQENDVAMHGLQERVSILKKISTDIHEEVHSQNILLDFMGSRMDASRGMLSATSERFKRVFETKSGKSLLTLVAVFVCVFLLIYFLTR